MPTAAYYKKLEKNNINQIKKVLSSGGVVIYPTETVWALGCISVDKKAVDKIYQIKKRKQLSPLISLLANYQDVEYFAEKIDFRATELKISIDNPPTIIYPNCKKKLQHLSNDLNEIAFRVTPLDFLKKIIKLIDSPLTSTSANISGQKNPVNFKDIDKSIIDSVDLILNFDINLSGKASSIIKINQKGEIQYIRK
jgi:L-threonylcarbamoyladenylate synthase